MKRLLFAVLVIALCGTAVNQAQATVINFDDLTGSAAVPSGYAGLTWGPTWNYYDGEQYPYTPKSAPVRAYDFAASEWFAFSGPVDFQGAYFAGYANVYFQGYLGGNLVGTSADINTTGTPTFLAANFSQQVDKVYVVTNAPDYFVMDDVTYTGNVNPNVVPEPATMALLGFGLTGLLVKRKKSIRS